MFHRSERLLLRPPWPEDWHAVHAGIAEESVVRNLARAPWPYAEDNARDWCALAPSPYAPTFVVTLADSGEAIGCIGIDPSGEGGAMELGYWIARAHWGAGYATEAALGMIEIARMSGERQLTASHFVDNPASGKVLRKAGFVPTGRVEPRFSAGRGEEAPCVLYRLDLATHTCAGAKAA